MAKKQPGKTKAESRLTHRIDRYARDVKNGRIVAGPLVRLAAERHLKDRRRRDIVFSEQHADHAIGFFEKFLRLPDALDENGDPKPFILEPALAFIVGSLFGWLRRSDGLRRFREGYIEMGKGNGKTPLLAGIGLYGLTMSGRRGAEIYAAATDRDQAGIMFRDAERMVDASPQLAPRLHRTPAGEPRGIGNISYSKMAAFFRPFSREQGAKSGRRPYFFLVDEVHEHPSAEIINKGRAGMKTWPDPLALEITNSGFNRTSICWQHHEHADRVLRGTVKDDRFFAYVCALDEGDDPLMDRKCWPKANPLLGVTITEDYLARQVENAKNIPAETNTVLRLNFCVWTQQQSRFIDMAKWHACEKQPADEELVGVPCFAGIDLGQTDDLSSFVRIWLLDDGRVVAKWRFWIPEAALEKFPNRPYDEWRRGGWLTVTEGDITDYDVVEATVAELCHESGVRECAYDKRFAQQMALHLQGQGITMVDTPQGFQLNEALHWMSGKIVEGLLCHGDNPIASYQASNAVARAGRNKEIRLDKDKAADKIDGIAALAMASSRAIAQELRESAYADGQDLMLI